MLQFVKNIFYLLFLLALVSCGNNEEPKTMKVPDFHSKKFQDKLIDANKMYLQRENDEIDQYVAHRGWQMITTGTGVRYMVLKKTTGEQAKEGQVAKVNYKISLLDGTLCYSSETDGAREFLIGQDNVESGIHEGIQYLHVGEKAVFIIPSHLAHGLVGDESKIPPQASVVYEIELLGLH